MDKPLHMCSSQYVSGYRRGQPCPYRASAIVLVWFPFLVCGYHARAYADELVYPLDWNLARIRAWQLGNIRALFGERVSA